MRINKIAIILTSILFYGVGCAPNVKQLSELSGYKSQAEKIISNANKKINIAKENSAEQYSLDNLINAVSNLKLANTYYNDGVIKNKKSYAKSKDNYLNAIKYGNSSIVSAELALEVSEVSKNIDEAKKVIDDAEKYEAGKYSQQKIENALASLKNAQTNFNAGNYPLANELALKAVKLAGESKSETEDKKKNLKKKLKRLGKAKKSLTESLKKNIIDSIIENNREIFSAEADLIKYMIDFIDRNEEKVTSKQSLAKLRKTETLFKYLIEEYYKTKDKRDNAERKLINSRQKKESLKEEITKIKVNVTALGQELDKLMIKKDSIIGSK